MKKWLPYLFAGAFGLWIVASLRPRPVEKGFHVTEYGDLPVLLNGRVQPIDSVARNSLLQIRGKGTVLLSEPTFTEMLRGKRPERMPAIDWLLEVFYKPEVANERRIFHIHHPELLSELQLDATRKRKDYSFNELIERQDTNGFSLNITWLQKEADRIRSIEPEVQTPLEKQVALLYRNIGTYHRLQNSVRPGSAQIFRHIPDFAEEIKAYQTAIAQGMVAFREYEAGREFKQEDLRALSVFLDRYRELERIALPLVLPPLDPSENREGWVNIGTGLMESMRKGEVHPAAVHLAKIGSAYQQDRPADFNRAVSEYHQWLVDRGLAREVRKGNEEAFFNHYAPFYKSMIVYVAALLLACGYWLRLTPWVRKAGFALLTLAFVVHTTGLIFRMYLEGRPPVTNLYSSAIFVGWGAVLFGGILERVFRNGIGMAVASMIGFSTLIIAHHLSLSGDTMEMLRAVLDTNFWLATHVVTITIGYASMFVAGFLAIIYIVRGLFTATLTQADTKALTRMVYGIVCLSTLFSFVGTILGGIWADQSWGRFWGWDPKENGALMIVLWCAIVLHARWGGLIRERGLMAMAVFGNIVTAFSWFGVNMLGIGLHSYGFMDAAFKWLIGFVATQLLLIGLAMLPLRCWKSFRHLPEVVPTRGGEGATGAVPAEA